jgi:hypothetical protein
MKDEEINLLFRIVEEETGITKEQMLSRSRKVPIVTAKRMMAVVFRRHTKLRFWRIAEILGVYNHSSVVHYLKTHQNFMDTEYDFKKTFITIESRFVHSIDTVEVRLERLLKERESINKEIMKLRKLESIKHA